jgi:hypothetical protein
VGTAVDAVVSARVQGEKYLSFLNERPENVQLVVKREELDEVPGEG